MDLTGRAIRQYQVLKHAGTGALGPVYEARHTETGRSYAVNDLHAALIADPARFKALADDVRKVAALRHPNIARIYELIPENNSVYLITEWIEGDNLEFWLLKHDAMAPTAAAEQMRPILSAVGYAHNLGLCHGWLQPANVMVTAAGPKLTNFGLERRVELFYGTRRTLAPERAIFMPPEWLAGKQTDERSDIFMLGALLFQMLTGKQRLTIPDVEGGKVPLIRDLLPQFDPFLTLKLKGVIARAMAELPEERFESAATFEAELLNAVKEVIRHTTAAFSSVELAEVAALADYLPPETARMIRSLESNSGANELEAPAAVSTPPRAPPAAAAEAPAGPWTNRRRVQAGIGFAVMLAVGLLIYHFSSSNPERRPSTADGRAVESGNRKSAQAAQPAAISARGVSVVREQWTTFQKEPRIALVVGINDYPADSGFRRLEYAAKDAMDFAAELTRQGYAVNVLLNVQALHNSVRKALRDARAATDGSESTLVFYFAGHGADQNGKQYLATYDSAVDDLGQLGFPLQEVQQILTGATAPRKMMFIDACRNDPDTGKRRGTSLERLTYLASSRGLRILNSTAPGQVSYEEPELGHGVFTHFLLKGLHGEAADTDGLITFNSLSAYAHKMMSDYTFRRNRLQVPYDSGEGAGDFLLAGALRASSGAQ